MHFEGCVRHCIEVLVSREIRKNRRMFRFDEVFMFAFLLFCFYFLLLFNGFGFGLNRNKRDVCFLMGKLLGLFFVCFVLFFFNALLFFFSCVCYVMIDCFLFLLFLVFSHFIFCINFFC